MRLEAENFIGNIYNRIFIYNRQNLGGDNEKKY